MASRFRKSPPVCLAISLLKLFTGKLRYSKRYLDSSVKMEDRSEFSIFRHITIKNPDHNNSVITFIVSFKFAHLSHNKNKLASIIPMLLITGFPGFMIKIYAVNHKNGHWQGMYQWKSKQHLDDYKNSFVFKMMNKRAISDTLKSTEFEGQSLIEFIEINKIQ